MQKKRFRQSKPMEFLSNDIQKILFIVLCLAVIFRVFSIFAVPEPAYNDSVYHLELAQQLMQGGQITKETPPFLYHLLLAGFFGLTGLPVAWPFVKVLPLVVMLLQISFAYMLLKRAFPKTYLVPLIFFSVFPWETRIGSVNMVDSFCVLATTIFAYFSYRLASSETKKGALLFSSLAALSFLPMAFSKTNVIFLMPALLLGFALLLFSKRNFLGLAKPLAALLVAGLFAFSFLAVSQGLPSAPANPSEGGAPAARLPVPVISSISPVFFPKSIAAFFDFPHESSFSKMPVLNRIPYTAAFWLFLLLMLPLFIMLLKGAYCSARPAARAVLSRKPFSLRGDSLFWLLSLLALLASLYPPLTIIREDEMYVRYLLPALPFIAILFGLAFEKSGKGLRRIALASLLLFALYSFAMTSASALFYYGVQQQNQPLYDYLDSSDEIHSVISMGNSRALRYYTGKEVLTLPMGSYSVEGALSATGNRTNYFAVSCYNEDLLASVSGLQSGARAQTIFERGCAKVLKVS